MVLVSVCSFYEFFVVLNLVSFGFFVMVMYWLSVFFGFLNNYIYVLVFGDVDVF